ncbi:UNVERIFIED_CONTAM: Retrovirus-related Pol polyprotein from transposon RE1 [Sesamum radiatum]|uniref:Retrovirus-related Pol polyprotein from transposon RE1 n=1 Tax=Sesamum radiatum TaxID=300843 RepID=A0AAW2NSM8_SESRA
MPCLGFFAFPLVPQLIHLPMRPPLWIFEVEVVVARLGDDETVTHISLLDLNIVSIVDLQTKKTIGGGHECDGLYHLDTTTTPVYVRCLQVPSTTLDDLARPSSLPAAPPSSLSIELENDLPIALRKDAVSCLWVFTLKYQADGSIDRCQADHSVFVQQGLSGIISVVVYVDDILISGSDIKGIEKTKEYLQQHFVTKDMEHPKYFLGIEIAHSKNEAYSDADYVGSRNDRISSFGYCTYFGGNLVTWRSKNQTTVARSSGEAEYRVMAHNASEMMWLKNLLGELGFLYDEPLLMYCDNLTPIHIARNPVFHERTKHLEVDCHFILEAVMSRRICAPSTSLSKQIADVFTKVLGCK